MTNRGEGVQAASTLGIVLAAAAGGALYGLADAALRIASDTLAPSPGRDALLAVLGAISLGAIAALAALPLLLPSPLRRAGLARPWTGFVAALLAVLLLDVGEWWFTPPPPFLPPAPLRGNAPLFALVLAALIAAGAGLAWLGRARRARLAALAILIVALVGRVAADSRSLPARGAPLAGAPNVLLVTLDTARADHFGAYGAPETRTPRFDGLAAGGALFERAYSQIPVTGPSHATILGGQGPWDHGGLLNGVPVNPAVALLAERLRAAGWRTGAFVSAYVLDGELGFNRGFEVYDDDFSWLQGFDTTLAGRLVATAGRHFDPDHVLERRGGRTVDAALSWLGDAREGTPDAPFFAWVHLFDPHGPYTPPPPWDTAYYEGDPRDPAHTSMQQVSGVAAYLQPSLRGITDVSWVFAQYGGEISYTDEQLGRLLDWLESQGVADDTLVVVAGDHGESLGEHGVWFNHGDDLFNPSTQVPLAMRLPGKVPAGQRVADLVELTDIAPTIYELIGVPAPDTVLGRSLAPAAQAADPRPFARGLCFDREANLAARERGEITQPVHRMVALRDAASLYVHREAPGAESAYYDLALSPDETVAVNPGVMFLQRREAEAKKLLERMSAEDVARSGAELDEETRKNLEALGYVE